MDSKLKKIASLSILSLALLGKLQGVDDVQMRNMENRMSALEKRKGGNEGGMNPSARPFVKDPVALSIQADALLMRAAEDNLDYAIETSSALNPVFVLMPSNGGHLKGRIKNARYKWELGCRVKIEYDTPYDGWDLFSQWMWIHSSRHGTHLPGVGQSFFPTALIGSQTPSSANPQSIATALRLRLNLLDLGIGREFFVSKWLTLRPHTGLRALWLDRKFKAAAIGGNLTAVASASQVINRNSSRYQGMGLCTGVDGEWGIASGWSLYSQCALSLIYGQQRYRQGEIRNNLNGTTSVLDHLGDKWMTVRAMSDLALGLRWSHLFSKDLYRICVQLGWEGHQFFGLQRLVFPVNIPANFAVNRSDLSLNGVVLNARFDF